MAADASSALQAASENGMQLHEAGSAATNAEDCELQEEEIQIQDMRLDVDALRSDRDLLQPSNNAPAGKIPPHPDDSIPFLYGDTLQIPSSAKSAPLHSIAVSVSGQYIAVASWSRIVLFEESAEGLGFQKIAVYRAPSASASIAALCFADQEIDTSALVLTSGDVCIGWDPNHDEALPEHANSASKESDGVGHDHWYEANACASVHIWMRFRAWSPIVALSMARGPGRFCRRELVLLGTAANYLEVYDLYPSSLELQPTMLHRISTDGTILAVALASLGSIAWALCSCPFRRDSNAVCAWQVQRHSAYGCAMLWTRASQFQADAGSLAHCFAHNEALELLAVGTLNGDVHVFRTSKLGSTIAIAETIHDALHATGYDSEARWWEDREPSVAFCGESPLLAVGSPTWVVLLYQYRPHACRLELVVRLKMFSSAGNSCRLAWAPKLGALWACYDHEIQYWLRDTVNYCPKCEREFPLPEPLTGICSICQSPVSMKDTSYQHIADASPAPSGFPVDIIDRPIAEHLMTELTRVDDPQADYAEESSETEDEEDAKQQITSFLFVDDIERETQDV